MTTASSRPVFAILGALVEERAGLHYGLADADLFLERVSGRAEQAGFDSLLDYYYYLRYDPGGPVEFDELVSHLVVNETYFFRELQPLRLIVDRFVRPLVKAGQRPRIWSAACSTGEEPLTLAMLLAEAGLLASVELLATDISSRALAKAKSGMFSRRSLRQVAAPELAQRWLSEQGGQLRVAPELIDAIEWRQLNLCAAAETAAVRACDVILCRNVLIYFRDETVVRVIQGLATQLCPSGVLIVGVSESLLRFGTALACEELDQVFYYRRVI